MKAVPRWPAYLGVFAAAFDNFAMTPLVRAIAGDLKVELAEATAVATAYYLAYGLFQVPWGMVSERVGRVTTFRLGLAAGALGSLASVFAGSLETLLVARFIAGAGMASAVPAVIAWIGDVVPEKERPGAAMDMNSVYAVGAASGVLGAGLLADRLGWHAGFGVSGVFAVLALVSSLKLFAPPRPVAPGSVRAALSVKAIRRLAVIGFVEGGVLFGLFAFLAPTLLRSGSSASTTGLLIAGYGVSVVIWSQLAKRAAGRVSVLRAMSFGGALLVLSWTAVAIDPGPVGVFFASIAMGATIVMFHANLQVWATQAAPHARGPGIAFFSGSLFVGASLGTRLARPLFDEGRLSLLFGLGAAVALVVTVVSVLARERSLRAPAA
ncbi:MAG: MFS transporter [Myxococcales bacterium]|nr:MFS transporter [Myxococcales bacterium]MDP3504365.1 MFS transporter [Myxococcales bacterium]